MADSPNYYIEVKTPSGELYTITHYPQTFRIGRARDNDLVLTDLPDIKDHHFVIRFGEEVSIYKPDNEGNPAKAEQPAKWKEDQYIGDRSNERKHYRFKLQPTTQVQAASKAHDADEISLYRGQRAYRWLIRQFQHRWLRIGLCYGILGLLVILIVRAAFNNKQLWASASAPVIATFTATWTATATSTNTMTPTFTPTPTPSPTSTSTPTFTSTPLPTPTSTLTPLPDTRESLNALSSALFNANATAFPATIPVGSEYWKLVSIQRTIGAEAEGKRGILVEVRDANGQRDVKQTVLFFLDTDQQPLASKPTSDKPSDYPYACEFPMFNLPPTSYGVQIQGLPSESVRGLAIATQAGVPATTSYLITFQLTRR